MLARLETGYCNKQGMKAWQKVGTNFPIFWAKLGNCKNVVYIGLFYACLRTIYFSFEQNDSTPFGRN